MGKPRYKASDGGQVDVLKGMEDFIKSELQQGSGRQAPIRFKVRLEAFPTGSPMSVWMIFLQQVMEFAPFVNFASDPVKV